MARIFTIVNQKGGVAKTTTSVNLATIFAIMGKRTLIVDIDPQYNATSGLGMVKDGKTLYNLFIDRVDIKDVISSTNVPMLDIIASDKYLSKIEIELANYQGQEMLLKQKLDSVREQYDYIFIDSPPSLNTLTLNGIVAADEIIIPMLCDFFSLEGLSKVITTINLVKKKINNKLKIGGILFTMYDKRSRLTQLVEEDVRKHLGKLVYKTKIPRNIKLAEAPSHGKAAVIYDHKSSGSIAYMDLAKEIDPSISLHN